MDVNAFIHHLTKLDGYEQQIAHIQYIPAGKAVYGKMEKSLHPVLKSRLESLGINSLYIHQAMAINAALSGKNVMVSTASASGKTLCYNIPVLESMLADSSARALYLFPTKALAQDQLRSLNQLACPDIIKPGECSTFDGDTPQWERTEIKKTARIILT
jgi:DEAD/DEAH box helicase domain-containing protein